MALRYYSRLHTICGAGNCHGQTLRPTWASPSAQVCTVKSLCLDNTTNACRRQKSLHTACVLNVTPFNHNKPVLCSALISDKRLSHGRLMGTSVLSKFTSDIDLDELREEVKREARETGEHIQLVDRVKEIVAQRCAKVIQNLSPEDRKKLQVLQLEHNFLYSEGHDIPPPDTMTDEFWVEAMGLPSKSQRLKYYVHLQRKSYMRKSELAKRAANKERAANQPKQEVYEHGRLFMRIYDATMRKWLNYRLASAMQHGTPLVFDMNYADLMRAQEIKNTAHQLHDVYCLNRSDPSQDPFHLYFTECPFDNAIFKLMQIKTQDNPILLSTITERSYLDLFDKDKLVYLSPHAKQVVREFDHEAVYIVGAFNDKATQKPVSYARAVEQGIRCQRLPIDEHLRWNQGTKNLTLDQMIKIMMDLKNNLPWKTAFKAIPQRKLR